MIPAAPPSSRPNAVEGGASALVRIGAAIQLTGLLLPWFELRPNRLAAGELLGAGAWAWAGVAVATTLLLGAHRAGWIVWVAELAVLAGLVALGQGSAAALSGHSSVARVSAGGGWWLWMLGGAVSLWGASYPLRSRWRAWTWLPLALAYALAGGLSQWSVWQEGRVESARLAQETVQHARLTLSALGAAAVIGAPLAVWAARRERVARAALAFTGGVQAMPSLALLGLLIAPLSALSRLAPPLREVGVSGIGVAPALVALTLYALLPIVRNGLVALRGVPPAALDAALGMGMTTRQRLWRVELPLALPVWIAGLRQATVLLIGVTAVAALIGAGGLGVFILGGLNAAATDLILLGALPACALAVLADAAWRGVETWLARHYGRAGARGAAEP